MFIYFQMESDELSRSNSIVKGVLAGVDAKLTFFPYFAI